MKNLVFFLEEPSAKELLKGILPRLLPNDYDFRFVVFEGKQDLEKQISRKLKAWRYPESRFIILRDQDSGNCYEIKENLNAKCKDYVDGSLYKIRIACREIESWYLADLQSVEIGLNLKDLSKLQKKKKYRNPDYLESPSQELSRLTGSYYKLSGSREIGKYLDLDNKRSKSFSVFMEAILQLSTV